jgi:hypothetical protein
MTVLRYKNRLRRIFCFLFSLTWLVQQPAFGMTAILVQRAGSFIIVAADSRAISTGGGLPDDQTCKIQLLDKYSFFAGAGITYNKSGTPGEFPFVAKQEAINAYRPNASIESVADAWAGSMEAIFSKQPLTWKHGILTILKKYQADERIIVQGVFGRSHTDVEMRQVDINYTETPTAISFSHKSPADVIDDEAVITHWGTTPAWRFIAELLAGNTQKSKDWRTSTADEVALRGLPRVDGHAFEMKAVLDAAIAAAVDPTVGGEVAVLVLERGKPARWFSQAACTNQAAESERR